MAAAGEWWQRCWAQRVNAARECGFIMFSVVGYYIAALSCSLIFMPLIWDTKGNLIPGDSTHGRAYQAIANTSQQRQATMLFLTATASRNNLPPAAAASHALRSRRALELNSPARTFLAGQREDCRGQARMDGTPRCSEHLVARDVICCCSSAQPFRIFDSFAAAVNCDIARASVGVGFNHKVQVAACSPPIVFIFQLLVNKSVQITEKARVS
jgi:hypothetical protein